MEKREQARKLWEDSGGKMLLKDIAAQLGVSEGTLRSWKNRDGWGKDTATLQVLRADATQRARQRKRQGQVNRAIVETLENNEELTEKEKDFCLYYIHAPSSPAQAAMRTGFYKNLHSARTGAWEMLKKPAVQAEIKRLREMKRMAILADADDVIEMHMRIAFADITDYVEFGREEVEVMGPFGPIEIKNEETGENKKLTKEINVVKFKGHDQVDGTVIQQVKIGRDGASVKLADKQKSLEFLERWFLLNPMDKHKKDYDNKRLKLEERSVKVQEDKLHGITKDVDAIKEGMKELIDIINSPVPDRRLEDE
jgi:phage terminase small subunit